MGNDRFVRGESALVCAKAGLQIYFTNMSGEWIKGDALTLARALRIRKNDVHAYGVREHDYLVLNEYRRLRAKGYTASDALRAAKIRVRFEELEARGDVKLWVEPECDYYDDSYIDSWTHLSENGREREREKIRRRLNREGHWVVVGYVRDDPSSKWDDEDNRHRGFGHVDSCGGFIGKDWKDSGYDVDIRRACIEAYEARIQAEADELSARATFASV